MKEGTQELKKLASVTLDMTGFIASMIQIYQFIKEGQVELAFEQVADSSAFNSIGTSANQPSERSKKSLSP